MSFPHVLRLFTHLTSSLKVGTILSVDAFVRVCPMAASKLLVIRCPRCHFRFKVDRKFSGQTARCPDIECQKKLRIPQVADQDSPATVSVADPGQSPKRDLRAEAATPEKRRRPPGGSKDRRSAATVKNRGSVESTEKDEIDLDARTAFSGTRRDGIRAAKTQPLRVAKQKTSRAGRRPVSGIRFWQVAVGMGGVLAAVLAVVFAPHGSDSPANAELVAAEPVARDPFDTKLLPFVAAYCQDCHDGEEAQAGVDFSKWTHPDSIIRKDRQHWEKILAMIEIGAMPPTDADQPNAETRQAIVTYLEDKLYNLDCEQIDDPGRVTVRRLNRTEYDNTVRDLLGVDFRPADDFPSDDVGNGFDNMGDVLSLSPLLMEKYLDAAEQITATALPPVTSEALNRNFEISELKANPYSRRDDFLSLSSQGEVSLNYEARFSGEYVLRIRAQADQAGKEPARMQLRIDGRPVHVFDIRGQRTPEDYQHRLSLKAGRHQIAAAFINDYYVKNKADRNLYVGRFAISSPVSPEVADRVSKVISARPQDGRSVGAAATLVLKPFVQRAFRRPPGQQELQQFVTMVETVVQDGETYDFAIRLAMQAVLVSPSFLFRVEFDSQPDDPTVSRAVTDFELASRLSYFLWSSMPDDELFRLAGDGKLKEPDTLVAQTKRMLAHDKAQAVVANFAEQWLNLRMLADVEPAPEIFPEFDEQLRVDMKQETLLLFGEVMRADRSILDFLDADFTFVNERLAAHYGIPDIRGAAFQKVSLDKRRRAGLLTQASILTITSNPDRTSPVKRGKWIMENILGRQPPPPPPDVPELQETRKNNPDATLREQLEKHRADPGCAACHRTMDTIGFGFENFDAVGLSRETDGDHPVDSSGRLPSGEEFSGPVELVQILRQRKVQFSRCMAEKMLTYAIGRGLSYYDRCAVDEILDRLNRNDYRFSELVLGIVQSKPFLKRRGEGDRE
ncbi:MAG: DUF1592 domain-containing protein [Planctomycetaceae bacterium]